MASDLETAVSALLAKQAKQETYFNYYEGKQPVVYTRERLRQIFSQLDAKFTENWAAVVIDACADRIQLQGFSVPSDAQAQTLLEDAWRVLSLAIEADDVHEAALIAGESFLTAWLAVPTAEYPEPEVVCCYNDPRMCHMEYDRENPRRRKWAAKWHDGTDGKRYLTLYYADRLEYYVSRGKASGVQNGKSFVLRAADDSLPENPADNPWGTIPLFHFENKRRSSDLENVVPLQNGINKLLVDMMAGAEFGAFPQRWAITQAELGTPLKNAPNLVWELPGGDGTGQPTQVGQFATTDLQNYLSAIGGLVNGIASITRTPWHYFLATGAVPSGESLLAMEAPLNKKARDRIERFLPEWRRVASFLCRLAGMDIPASAIEPVFEEPRTVQPKTQADVRKASVESGIPLRTLLRDEGWTDAELAQMDEDRAAGARTQSTGLASALVEARGRFNGGDMADG